MPMSAAQVTATQSKIPTFSETLEVLAGAYKDNRQPTAAEIEAARAAYAALVAEGNKLF